MKELIENVPEMLKILLYILFGSAGFFATLKLLITNKIVVFGNKLDLHIKEDKIWQADVTLELRNISEETKKLKWKGKLR